MKIFVAGSNGQLGHDVCDVLGRKHDVQAMDLPALDIADTVSVERAVAGGVDVIVNCAACTDVDGCESHRSAAWAVNAEGPGVLAQHAKACGALLIHLSTDYVFDGCKPVPEPYREDDATGPVSEYGRSKLAGEQAVRRTAGPYVIVRTSWLYGVHGGNFLKTMLRLALEHPERPIKVVNDQFGCPTWSYRLAKQLRQILEAHITGIVHASGEGLCTWFELASCFLDAMAIPHRIEPCTTAEYPTPARRPANSILENARLKKEEICVMRNWREDIYEFVARERERLIGERDES